MDTQLAQQLKAAMARFSDQADYRFFIAYQGESFLGVKVWKTFTTPSPKIHEVPGTLIFDLKDGSVVHQ